MYIIKVSKRIFKYFLSKFIEIKTKSKIMSNCNINFDTIIEGHSIIHNNVNIASSTVGFGTYIGANSRLMRSQIGRYCSIAENVNLIVGRHPTKSFVSTHPAFFSILRQAGFTYVDENKFTEQKYADNENRYYSIIGNDVWIGSNVSILDGCRIGDGVIIATGSVVLGDLEPYFIYGGIPAKKIGQRFSNSEIDFLLELQWWNYPKSWIEQKSYLFSDIELFINEIKKSDNERD